MANMNPPKPISDNRKLIIKEKKTGKKCKKPSSSSMENENLPKPIPDGWEMSVSVNRNGKKRECFYCPGSWQHFFKYEDMMRYVSYAKEAELSIYSPNFRCRKRRNKNVMPASLAEFGCSGPNQTADEGKGEEVVGSLASEPGYIPSQPEPRSEPELYQGFTDFASAPVMPQSYEGMEKGLIDDFASALVMPQSYKGMGKGLIDDFASSLVMPQSYKGMEKGLIAGEAPALVMPQSYKGKEKVLFADKAPALMKPQSYKGKEKLRIGY